VLIARKAELENASAGRLHNRPDGGEHRGGEAAESIEGAGFMRA